MQGFSVRDPAIVADPEAFYDRVLRLPPAFFSEADDAYILSRHEDVKRLIVDFEVYDPRLGSLQAHHVDQGPYDFDPIFLMSPPDHTRLRKLSAGGFSMAAVARFAAEAEAAAGRAVSALPRDGEAFDLVGDFTEPLVIDAILSFVEIPEAVRGEVAATLRDQIRHEGDFAAMAGFAQEFANHMIRHLHHVEDNDVAGFPRALKDARIGQDRLTSTETFGMLMLAAIGGAEDMARGLAGVVRALHLFPAARDRFLADPDGMAGAVLLEGLRLFPTTQFLRRVTRRPVEVQGVTIPAGASVIGLLAVANRDAGVFPSAGEMILDRRNVSASLTFGGGPHVCIGKHVARVVMGAGLRALADRLDRLVIDEARSERSANGPILGFARLTAREAAAAGSAPVAMAAA